MENNKIKLINYIGIFNIEKESVFSFITLNVLKREYNFVVKTLLTQSVRKYDFQTLLHP